MRRLGDYQTIDVLGEGLSGITYLAEHVDTRDTVVVKVCRSGGRQEAETLARLTRHPHDNVVRIRTSFDSDAGYCVVMDYVDGKPLDEAFQSEADDLDFDEWWPIFKGILFGVDHIHRHGLIHQDLKPENVILKPNGGPVIVDLGGARELDGSQTRYWTPGYEPWEVTSRTHNPGPYSDIFTLALVFAEALLGTKSNGPDDISRVRRELVEIGAFGEAIAKGLLHDPKARPQTITEWIAELVGGISATAPTDDDGGAASRNQARSSGITAGFIMSEVEDQYGLPPGSVAITVGYHRDEFLDAAERIDDAVAHELEKERDTDPPPNGLDDTTCGNVAEWASYPLEVAVRVLNPDGSDASPLLMIKNLKRRFGT